MCGIVGCFSPNGLPEGIESRIDRARQVIRHRGPDASSVTRGDTYAVAFNRLAINDLSPNGMQPFKSHGLTVFVNGEIYNFVELREQYAGEFTAHSGSDVEIVPFLWAKRGEAALNEMNGMFAMVIIDEAAQRCHLVVDRFGVRPMFHLTRGGVTYFASEQKALAELVDLEPNPRYVALTMSMGTCMQPFSVFRDVRRLPAGETLTIDGGGVRESLWYSPSMNLRDWALDELGDAFYEHFDSSIELRLRSDVPVGGYISGGLDSSLICVTAHDRLQGDFHAFNAVIADKASHETDIDNINAERISREHGIVYHPVGVDYDFYDRNFVRYALHHDEIFSETAFMVFYSVAEVAGRHVRVILDGIGGDELFGGYPWQYHQVLARKGLPRWWGPSSFLHYSPWLEDSIRQFAPGWATRYQLLSRPEQTHMQAFELVPRRLFGPEFRDVEAEASAIYRNAFLRNLESCQGDYFNAVHLTNFRTVVNHQTTISDRGGMASSVEGRNPFLDFRLVELMLGVPSAMKLENGPKWIFRKLAERRLPDYVTKAPKSGPALPVKHWLRERDLDAQLRGFISRHQDDLVFMLGETTTRNLMQYMQESEDGIVRSAVLGLLIWSARYLHGEAPAPGLTVRELLQQ